MYYISMNITYYERKLEKNSKILPLCKYIAFFGKTSFFEKIQFFYNYANFSILISPSNVIFLSNTYHVYKKTNQCHAT
jgi:hypothetical protein